MIIRNFKQTTLCCLKLEEKLDTGPIYFKKKISLLGSGEKIFLNIYKSIIKMILQFEKKFLNHKSK